VGSFAREAREELPKGGLPAAPPPDAPDWRLAAASHTVDPGMGEARGEGRGPGPHRGGGAMAPDAGDRLYCVARRTAGLAMRVSFGRLRVQGSERIPRTGPVVLAANHPRGILDSFSLALATPRKVHFLARSTLFRRRWLAGLLRRLGAVPIYRRLDAASQMRRNVDALQECGEILVRGGVLGIFPEGITHVDPQVKEMRTGAARLVLEAEARHDFCLGVRVVPVGINVAVRSPHRSALTLQVGEPLPAADWRERYAADPSAAVRELTATLRRAIEARVVHLGELAHESLVARACELFLDDWVRDPWILPDLKDPASREVELRRRVAGAVEYYDRYQPAVNRDMAERMEAYLQGLQKLRLTDAALHRSTGALPLLRRTLPTALVGLAGAPLAVSGWLIHELPRRLATLLARRLATHPAQIDVHRIWIGLQAFAVVYALALFAVHRAVDLGWRGMLVALVAFPVLGWVSTRYFESLRRYREDLRIVWLQLRRRTRIEELRFRRARLAQDEARLRRFLAEAPEESENVPSHRTRGRTARPDSAGIEQDAARLVRDGRAGGSGEPDTSFDTGINRR